MKKNKDLHRAKEGKNDEFYTQMTNIETELYHYKDQFRGKVVYCNCDDHLESHFTKYFALKFTDFGLKKLIATHFERDKPSTYCVVDGSDLNNDGQIDLNNIRVHRLSGNGDFRSPECIEFLKESDIVVTNPPFSLFREYIAQMVEYDKNFLVMGNVNAIAYKECFKLIKENKLWTGYTKGSFEFLVPDTYPLFGSSTRIDESGKKYIHVNGVRWFTNLPVKKRSEDLGLYLTYEEGLKQGLYPKYDNYDAINVDKVNQIPTDYFGPMGVPITFFDKWVPSDKEFDIVKFRKGDDDKDLAYTVERERERERESTTVHQNYRSAYWDNLKSTSLENCVMSAENGYMQGLSSKESKFEILGITQRDDTFGLRTKKYTKDDSPRFNDLNARSVIKIGNEYIQKYARIVIQRI